MAYAFGLSPPMAAVLGKVQMGWCGFATSKLRPMCHENRTKMNEAQLQFKRPKSRPNDPNGVPTVCIICWVMALPICCPQRGPNMPAACGLCLLRCPASSMFQQSVSFADFPRVALPKVVATNVGVQHQAHLPGNIRQETDLPHLKVHHLPRFINDNFEL